MSRGRAPPLNSVRSARAVTEFPLTDDEKTRIALRLHELEVEHQDLDDVINRLAGDPSQDQLQLRRLKKKHASGQTGEFGADMKVSLVNDGPVTFWLRVPAPSVS